MSDNTLSDASETLQKEHYERIAADYDAHYNDAYSQQYMRKFIYEPLLAGIEISGKKVLEAMSGGGQLTQTLLDKGAKVIGLDISHAQTANFRRRHKNAEVICASMLNSGIKDESFDIVIVIGGLHHLPPKTSEGLREIHRILKKGGYLCFMEPHSESVADYLRNFWYKRDSLFAENEAAINVSKLRREFADSFEFKSELFLGNVAYLLVMNSLVFRVPLRLKPIYSPSLIFAEKILNPILGKPLSCFVVAQWRKK